MTVHYQERQRFRQDWLWALLLVGAVPAALLSIVAIAVDGGETSGGLVLWTGVVLLAVFGPLVAFYYAALSLRVDDEGLALRLWPLQLRERSVPPADIEAVTVEEYDAFGDYGGVGIRLNPTLYRWGVSFDGPLAYIVQGDRAVRIRRSDDRDLVVSSTDAPALAAALRRVSGSGPGSSPRGTP